ncbi:MAG: hypothetical protein AB7G08_31615 [Hyphomicrobiaceae bacterium]
MAKGWIIEVRIHEAGCVYTQRYDVAISDRDEAIAQVRRRLGALAVVNLAAVEELFEATFYGLGLSPGDIMPRLRRRE